MPQKRTSLTEPAALRLIQVIQMTGLKQQEFAALLGAKPQRVSNWTAGKHLVPIDFGIQIAERWDLSLDWLYTGKTSALSEAKKRDLAKYETKLEDNPKIKLIQGSSHAGDKRRRPRAGN